MIVEPSKATLKKYGLTASEWWSMLDRQGYVCPICKRQPSSGKFHIDHEHIKNWKKLSPERRRAAVRGLLCWYDNRWYMSRNMTIQKASNMQIYLMEYAERKST